MAAHPTQNASVPTVTFLAGLAGTPFSWNHSYPLNFTVPSGVAQVVYAWTLGGNFSAFQPPVLPSGMSVAATIGYAGMAIGNLSAGNYSTNLSYTGFLNTVTIAIYGISGANNTYQFASTSQINPDPYLPEQVSLALAPGGTEYLALATTGGSYPVTNASLILVDEQTPASRGGMTGFIGRQFDNLVSFTTIALGEGIVGVAINANASQPGVTVGVLTTFSWSFGGWNESFPVPFVVPTAIESVVYVWSLGGNFSPFLPPVLPSGLSVIASDGWEGIAVGNLTAGTYLTNLSYAGYTNFASIAVYGVSGPNLTFQAGATNLTNPSFPSAQQLNLTLPTGAVEYLGVLSTGGTYQVTNVSFSQWDEEAWATLGGVTGVIGRQTSNVLSLSTLALGYGIAGVGIYANGSSIAAPVTFEQKGLPAGAPWTLAVAGSTFHTTASTLVLLGLGPSLPYVIAGPSGFQVTGIAPSGTLSARGAPLTETFRFARAGTATLRFREQGLESGKSWCVKLGGWTQCSATGAIAFLDLTPGTYSYWVSPVPLYTATAKVGHANVGLVGSMALARSVTVSVRFDCPTPVMFQASGLPSGAIWSITVKGVQHTSTNGTLVLVLDPGTYHYKVTAPSGFAVRGASRTFHLTYTPATVSVVFHAKA